MAGIIVIAAGAVWTTICVWAALRIAPATKRTPERVLLATVVLLILLPLPIADELAAKKEFLRLCDENSVIVIDAANPEGRTVWYAGTEKWMSSVGLLTIVHSRRTYADVKTGEPVYHYTRLDAGGGWILRRLTEGRGPLLFDGTCQPNGIADWERALKIQHVNRPVGE